MGTGTSGLGIISVTSDFAAQSQAVGVMEAVAYGISPGTKYINLMHGLPGFDLLSAARTFEAVVDLPVGNHVCVCDPGVGPYKNALILGTARGDHLIGPDNGVLLPAARRLGGPISANRIENAEYQRQPVSPVFHGRDLFIPAAAHLAEGVAVDDFGPAMEINTLCQASFEEANIVGSSFRSLVIHVNEYGSAVLNVLASVWDDHAPRIGENITLTPHAGASFSVCHGVAHSDVDYNADVILKDDYGRVELGNL